MVICLHCGKEIELKKESNPYKQKFCNHTCDTRFHSKKRYYQKIRDSPEYLERKKENMRMWYENNKEKQKKTVMRDYKTHKKEWNERKYVDRHREEILKIISKFCYGCGKEEIKIIHHETYDFPTKEGNWNSEKSKEYLKEYCLQLKGFCSKKCHRGYERKANV